MVSIPQRIMGEALFISAKKTPNKIAVIARGKEYTYSELQDAAALLKV